MPMGSYRLVKGTHTSINRTLPAGTASCATAWTVPSVRPSSATVVWIACKVE